MEILASRMNTEEHTNISKALLDISDVKTREWMIFMSHPKTTFLTIQMNVMTAIATKLHCSVSSVKKKIFIRSHLTFLI